MILQGLRRLGQDARHAFIALLLAGLAAPALATDAPPTAPNILERYKEVCATCHGVDRLGGMGPALLPDNLERLRRPAARKVIAEGRAATQMIGYGDQFSADEIDALVEYIYTPAPEVAWDAAAITASRIVYPAPEGDKPVFSADPLNLFLVVEVADHHVSVLDGDKLEPIHRFTSRFALHGGPKFTENGRYVFFASRDGWITKYDLWNLAVVAEIRAGINTRNVAVSLDGRHVAVANYLPRNLVLLDGELNLKKVLPAVARNGELTSRVSAVYDAAPRNSFIAALKDVPEIWEISYDEKAEPIYDGLVHDYRMGEAIPTPGYLNPRRTLLEAPLDDFFFDQDYRVVMGASRDGHGQVVNLDVRRKIGELPLDGMPHLGSGITWTWTDPQGEAHTVMASTNLKAAEVTVIDMRDWSIIKRIPTRGPGFFLRSHANSRYAFVDSMMKPDVSHILQVIDKQTLEVVKELSVEPGRTLAHVEFTRDGRYALASLWEDDGALIVYDAQTLAEVRRLPMRKPVGKYNVWNKITREEGTSH